MKTVHFGRFEASVRDTQVLARMGTLPGPTYGPGVPERSSSMHDDSSATDTTRAPGPKGSQVSVDYYMTSKVHKFGGMCPCFGLAENGDLLTISFERKSTTVVRLDHKDMVPRSTFRDSRVLPPRPISLWKALTNTDNIFKSTEGGTYFFVDRFDRMVIPTLARGGEILVIGQSAGPESDFRPIHAMDARIPWADRVVSVQPTHEVPTDASAAGSYWFTTKQGRLGVARSGDRPQVPLRVVGGSIDNSFVARGPSAYVVTSEALHRFDLVGDDIVPRWSQAVPSNGKTKYGQINPGSGTTPTLMGDEYVVLADGESDMAVCVYSQVDGRLVARRPVFSNKKGVRGEIGSGCENSIVVSGRLIFIGNTYGYINPLRASKMKKANGLLCLELDDDGSLNLIWERDHDVMTAVPKLTVDNDVLFIYTMNWTRRPVPGATNPPYANGEWEWFLEGIDALTGNVAYRIPIFSGVAHRSEDNGWATMCIANRAVYLGMWNGAMRIGDV